MLTTKGGQATRVRESHPDFRPIPAANTAPVPANDGFVPATARGGLTAKQAAFLAWHKPESPCLVVDLDIVARNYDALAASLAPAQIYYAVKANPAPEILRLLRDRGSRFDVASRGEVKICLDEGIPADRLSFGNTIKKATDIAWAYAQGVRLFAFDAAEELDKLAEHAPGAAVFCRLLVDGEGAEWPLSRKFGCSEAMAERLLLDARSRGLNPIGVSFHIGSQQCDLSQWDAVMTRLRGLYDRLAAQGLALSLINLGGGFPAQYGRPIPSMPTYGEAVVGAVRRHFGVQHPTLIAEPGRGLVGEAGVIEAEVVLVSRKDEGDDKRWVYLDVGKFGGLAETMEEAIKYRMETTRDGGPTGPVVIAGPTCDSADVLYEKTVYHMPLDLKAGDKVRILACGAYTTTYSSVAFNGFEPLKCFCI
jgi:ornithine decarboxylase